MRAHVHRMNEGRRGQSSSCTSHFQTRDQAARGFIFFVSDAPRTNQTNKSPATGGLNPSTLPGDPCKTRESTRFDYLIENVSTARSRPYSDFLTSLICSSFDVSCSPPSPGRGCGVRCDPRARAGTGTYRHTREKRITPGPQQAPIEAPNVQDRRSPTSRPVHANEAVRSRGAQRDSHSKATMSGTGGYRRSGGTSHQHQANKKTR